jgi:hypothetical protein
MHGGVTGKAGDSLPMSIGRFLPHLSTGRTDQNPAHGSGWIIQVLSKHPHFQRRRIPPTAVGGLFKPVLFITPSKLPSSGI